MAAQAGVAPAPSRITTGWTTVIPLSNGAADRSCTCIDPLRTRMPRLVRPRQRWKWVSAAGLAPAVPRSQAEDVAATPRAGCPGKPGRTGGLVCGDAPQPPCPLRPVGDWRTRRDLHPQPSRRQRGALLIELRIREMVGSAGNAPVVSSGVFGDTRVTAGQPGRFPEIGSGGGSCTRLTEFMKLLSVLWSSSPQSDQVKREW
jgi:hypothetical protein